MDSIIPISQKNTLDEYMLLSGADNRPPMLDKDLYDSWTSGLELYMQNKENGRMILELVEHGPLIWPTIEENGTHLVEVPQIDSGLAVLVFKQGDDPIDAINKMMSFLSTVITSRFPSTNNQLRNLSNPRQQATIHDGRADDLDAYDSNYDEISTAKAVLMANLSSYGLDVLSKVPISDNTNIDMLNQTIQDTNSSAQQDALILSMFEQLSNQVTNYNKVNNDNLIAHETLSAELERYKERVKLLEERQNMDLGVNPSTSASGSKPYSNTKNDRIPRTSRSNEKNNVEVQSWKVKSRIEPYTSRGSDTLVAPSSSSLIDCRHGLVRGLLRLKFEKEHLCSACAMGKGRKQSHKHKYKDTNQEKLYLLHMDLCGPLHVASVNGKKNICTDNETEFVNQTLQNYYEQVGISHETSVGRTPQQNGFVERRNRTLVEAARTMKTDLSYLHVFCALCYPNNDRENLGKLQAKADIVFDEFFSPPASVASLILIEEALAPVESTGSPSSTIVDQDAPLPSTSQTTPQSQFQSIRLSAEKESHDLEYLI
uniref:Integrase catalytic domain-containing protein n=1 Tax=Tanacetum cinerariifolium TaxID=118510 RepID=A0A6L2NDM3_TANCI|nr:hypothetical protein [Tanacetum cinerariifolium]